MKKTHPLLVEGKKPERVLDALKHTLRQYVRRERNKPLPEGVDYWDFDCQMGLQADTAQRVHVAELNKALDALAIDGAVAVYVEILRKPGIRQSKPPAPEEALRPADSHDPVAP
jgi:hypothetical protein